MKYIIGIGGVTNGGKTTLTNKLVQTLPNCCVVHQDDFFKNLVVCYLSQWVTRYLAESKTTKIFYTEGSGPNLS